MQARPKRKVSQPTDISKPGDISQLLVMAEPIVSNEGVSMSLKRKSNPIYFHYGYLFRSVKRLANGSELLYCDKRKTSIGCTATAHRKNGQIVLDKPHHGHERQEDVAHAKLARYAIRQIAENSTASPKKLIQSAREEYGDNLNLSGTNESLARMIQRARKPKLETPPIMEDTEFFEGSNIKQEEPEYIPDDVDLETMLQSVIDQNDAPVEQPVTIPGAEFLNTLQQMISDTIHAPVRENTPTAVIADFLEVLASNSTNLDLKERASNAVSKIQNEEISSATVDALLESVLGTLGA